MAPIVVLLAGLAIGLTFIYIPGLIVLGRGYLIFLFAGMLTMQALLLMYLRKRQN